MTTAPRILAFAGSLRAGSWNKKLLQVAVEGARAAGGEVMVVDLRDYPMPIYDGDLEREHGLPEAAIRLKGLIEGHDGLLIATPEYNSGMTGALKNTLDWTSRRAPGEERPLQSYHGKVAAILATSIGTYGGMRSLGQARLVLTALGVLVIPQQRAVPKAPEAFDDDGHLRDPDLAKGIRAIGARLVEVAGALRGG